MLLLRFAARKIVHAQETTTVQQTSRSTKRLHSSGHPQLATTTKMMNRATIPLALPVRHQSPAMMRYCDCVSQQAVNRCLEPLRSARIRECLRTDGQDCGTESMLCQYVHCHCRQQVRIVTLLLSRGLRISSNFTVPTQPWS